MKCPKEGCEGKFKCKTGGMSKRTGHWTRKRICDICGYMDRTIEVSKREFGMEMELLEDLQKSFDKYNTNKEIVVKPKEDTDKDET